MCSPLLESWRILVTKNEAAKDVQFEPSAVYSWVRKSPPTVDETLVPFPSLLNAARSHCVRLFYFSSREPLLYFVYRGEQERARTHAHKKALKDVAGDATGCDVGIAVLFFFLPSGRGRH